MTTIERGPLTADLQQELRGRMPDVIADLRAKAAPHEDKAPRREAGYTIQNAAGDEAIVRIYDEIWEFGINALDLSAELDSITAPSIRVEINSRGGNVFDGLAIYNALRVHPSRVETRVDGIAASIASVIAQAGDHRVMLDSSQLMIHNAFGMVVGNQADHEQMAQILQQQDELISGVYASRSEKDAGHFLELMNAETWMTAERAVAEGLADEILTPSTQPKDRARTLNDEIAEAVHAVEAVVSRADEVRALRAEAGKDLSVTNRDSLRGLRESIDRFDGLLNDGTQAEDPELEEKRLALARRDSSFRAALPPQFLT